MESLAFVKDMFSQYYKRHSIPSGSVSAISAREFGFASFDGRMLRHKGFKSERELESFLQACVPHNAYLSCAYYDEPEAEMEKKGWRGADLVFDIDADHIPTSCDKIHDLWTCGKCGFTGRGVVPEACPVCGSEKFDESTWPCEVCLASAKHETVKLLDFLMADFGFSSEEVKVFFSGHRGYHVHVESQAVRNLDSTARREIVDYVSGLGIDAMFHGLGEKGPKTLSLQDTGWRGRIARGVHDFILNAEDQRYATQGLKASAAEALAKNKNAILRDLNKSMSMKKVKGAGPETWKKIVGNAITSQSANVDTVVTTDVHRLIRLGGTLHGKTGLKKTEFPVSAVDDFDPFNDAVGFNEGTVTVRVIEAPRFRLGDQVHGPYKNLKVELPTAAAILLICKKRAEIVE